MAITKNVLKFYDFLLTIKRSLAQSANSQQPTANSQQPTANSQQPTANSQQLVLTKIIFNFGIYTILQTRAVSDFFRSLFFYAFLAVCHAEFISVSRFRNKFAVTGRQEEILKQVQDDRSHTDYFDKLARYLTDVKYFVRTLHVLTVAQ